MSDWRLLSSKHDPSCGCLEQEFDTAFGFLFMHIKPDFSGDVFVDNGDEGQAEKEIKACSKEEFFKNTEKWLKEQSK